MVMNWLPFGYPFSIQTLFAEIPPIHLRKLITDYFCLAKMKMSFMQCNK